MHSVPGGECEHPIMNHPLIIGCKTLENEIRDAMQAEHLTCETYWVEAGLHNVPKNLRSALQAILDEHGAGHDYVLLATSFCGNSVSGLATGDFTLVIPRMDDCISTLLGSSKAKTFGYKSCYFLTDGWLRGERNIWKEHEYTMEKFGPEMGEELFRMMFGHYTTLAVLDTGCYNVGSILPETRRIADALHLEHKIIPGSNAVLRQQFSGVWPENEFLLVPPHTVVRDADLILYPGN